MGGGVSFLGGVDLGWTRISLYNIHLHTNIYNCIYIHIYIYIYMYIYMYICLCMYISICISVYLYIYIYISPSLYLSLHLSLSIRSRGGETFLGAAVDPVRNLGWTRITRTRPSYTTLVRSLVWQCAGLMSGRRGGLVLARPLCRWN